MNLNKIIRFLNKELKISHIKDSSRNGLQFRGKEDVNKIGFAVDASIEAFRKARRLKCDLLVVHHGILWRRQRDRSKKARKDYLKRNRLSLYAAHLPLDLHHVYGNNAQLCSLLHIGKKRKFGRYRGVTVGYKGVLSTETSLKSFVAEVNDKLKTKCRVLAFGPRRIKTVCVVSGGGASALNEAIMQKLDCFFVGEAPHGVYHHAKEGKINLIMAGHYKTETLGVKALAALLKKEFGVKTVFIDVPTGM